MVLFVTDARQKKKVIVHSCTHAAQYGGPVYVLPWPKKVTIMVCMPSESCDIEEFTA